MVIRAMGCRWYYSIMGELVDAGQSGGGESRLTGAEHRATVLGVASYHLLGAEAAFA